MQTTNEKIAITITDYSSDRVYMDKMGTIYPCKLKEKFDQQVVKLLVVALFSNGREG